MIQQCPKCNTKVIDPIQCDHCQLVFSAYRDHLNFVQAPKVQKNYESIKVSLFAIPLTLGLSFLISNTFLKNIFIFFRVWAHEFGHAFMSWLSGVKATPLSFGNFGMTFNSGVDRSLFVFVCFIFLMSALYAYGKKEDSPFFKYFSLVLSFLSIFFTWITPEKNVEELIIFAGFGGEMILATVLIVAFYLDFPRRWYWKNFMRWPFLFLGIFILIVATQDWIEVYKLNSLSPFGTNYSAESGDLNRLISDYNWSFRKFIQIYLGISITCWFTVLGSYIYSLKNIRLK